MKERLILFCMLLLCGIGVSRAQSGNAKDFDQKEETIVQKLQQAVNEKNYKEAEKNGKALITLFKEQDENTQKKYSWLIQSYYYNLACFQSLLKKKGEAIKNLELAYDNGFQDYNHMMNDTDLDNLRSDKRFNSFYQLLKKDPKDVRLKILSFDKKYYAYVNKYQPQQGENITDANIPLIRLSEAYPRG